MADLEQRTGMGPRGRWRDIDLAQPDPDNKAYAQYISHAPAQPLGHTEMTVSSTAAGLPTIPANAKRAVLFSRVEFCYTDDGSTPSITHGMVIPAGVVFIYDTEPTASFQVWSATPGDLRVAYYG